MSRSFEMFLKERDAALLSLDEAKIRAYGEKWGASLAADSALFWASVHKARTALKSLPREARLLSKQWLEARGLSSLDGGDLDRQEAL